MRKQLLVVSALCALGLSVSAASAAPSGGILDALKANASESRTVQHVRYDRHRSHTRHHYRNCWWKDRWLCRWFW
jgi:hypothetical protein